MLSRRLGVIGNNMTDFASFFRKITGHPAPFAYQVGLATEAWPDVVDVPTGLGKTAAVLAAWLWKRLNDDAQTGRRLIYCLPMRTLVEQTRDVADALCRAAEPHFAALNRPLPGVHVLMGGAVARQWDGTPGADQILIGTQDMLLSRALNRGYGMSRFRWPVQFGLLNNDCLWVFDETQLMGVAVETSAQLHGFREQLGTLRRCHSVWMSATLSVDQLDTIEWQAVPVSRRNPRPNNRRNSRNRPTLHAHVNHLPAGNGGQRSRVFRAALRSAA